ncbi:MAG: leucine-rich repeat domain-containing protein [Ruminococcus sp.]|nr:leucine-rich repeat domain-containing protein [Ruminococcus sp.]
MGFEIKNHVLIRYTDEPDVNEITVPDGITKIKKEAFAKSNLKSVFIPDTVTEIGYDAFYDCMFLEQVRLPAKLKIISGATFEECTSLKHIILPDGLEQIDGSAFFNTNIKEADIPESVKFIGSCAFGAPDNDFGWITLNFHKNQKKTRMRFEVLWLGYTPEFRILDFFDNPCYETFSLLESNYKIQIAVSYYDVDDNIKNYLKRTIRKAVTLAIDRNDTELLTDLLNTGFITKKNIDFMIQYAIEHTQNNGNPELQVMLTDYKYQHFPADTSRITKTLKL